MVEREIKEAEDQKLRYLEEMSNLEKEGSHRISKKAILTQSEKCFCYGRLNDSTKKSGNTRGR